MRKNVKNSLVKISIAVAGLFLPFAVFAKNYTGATFDNPPNPFMEMIDLGQASVSNYMRWILIIFAVVSLYLYLKNKVAKRGFLIQISYLFLLFAYFSYVIFDGAVHWYLQLGTGLSPSGGSIFFTIAELLSWLLHFIAFVYFQINFFRNKSLKIPMGIIAIASVIYVIGFIYNALIHSAGQF